MKELKPTTVAVLFTYNLFCNCFCDQFGKKDELNMVKIVSAVLLFSGVYWLQPQTTP
jgi:hypothetical protein